MVGAGLLAVAALAIAWSREALGEGGLLAVAAISGLTDMDAITLSTARLVESGGVEASTAWKPIVVAAISNQIFKLGMIGVIAGRKLFLPMAVLTGINVAAGVVLLLVW